MKKQEIIKTECRISAKWKRKNQKIWFWNVSDIVRHCSTRFRKLSDRNSKMFNNVRHKNGFRTPAVIGCHWLPKVRKLAVIGCFWQSSAAGFSCIKISVADLFSWKLSDKCSTFWQTRFLTLFPDQNRRQAANTAACRCLISVRLHGCRLIFQLLGFLLSGLIFLPWSAKKQPVKG